MAGYSLQEETQLLELSLSPRQIPRRMREEGRLVRCVDLRDAVDRSKGSHVAWEAKGVVGNLFVLRSGHFELPDVISPLAVRSRQSSYYTVDEAGKA